MWEMGEKDAKGEGSAKHSEAVKLRRLSDHERTAGGGDGNKHRWAVCVCVKIKMDGKTDLLTGTV